MSKYFVYTNTETERDCPYFTSLDEAIRLYNATEMNKFRDNVCLGVSSDRVTPKEGFCFDVVHKFFDENILINDYLNHEEEEAKEAVERIKDKLSFRYQWTPDILNGALINYESSFASYNGELKGDEWNEAYVSTLNYSEMIVTGWVKPTSETYDNYGWNYPDTASYISIMNVPVYDNRGCRHDVDIDPRVYLQLLGKKVSINRKENE